MSDNNSQLKQRVVYVRVTKMYLPRSNPNVSRNLFQQIQPGYSGVISPLIPIQMLDMYSSSAILAFRFLDQKKSNVTFIVTELTQLGENEACRLCLPLSWFPHGYVVHHYFPFITRTPQNGKPFIELDVHIADVQTTPFSAYYGTLTVIPTWVPPPQMTAGATVLVTTPVQIQEQPIPQPPVSQQSQHPQNAIIEKKNQQKKKEKHKNKDKNKSKDKNKDEQALLNKKDHDHKETSSDDDLIEESEIQLEDIDDILNDGSLNQMPPPVLNPSQVSTHGQQDSIKTQEEHKDLYSQQQQQPQSQPQQYQHQPQQYQPQQQQPQQYQPQQQQPQQYQPQQQQPQQYQPQQQQPQQYQPQQPQQYQPQQQQYQQQAPISQHQKFQYPPFPPLPQQQAQPPQQTNESNQKNVEESKKILNPT